MDCDSPVYIQDIVGYIGLYPVWISEIILLSTVDIAVLQAVTDLGGVYFLEESGKGWYRIPGDWADVLYSAIESQTTAYILQGACFPRQPVLVGQQSHE